MKRVQTILQARETLYAGARPTRRGRLHALRRLEPEPPDFMAHYPQARNDRITPDGRLIAVDVT